MNKFLYLILPLLFISCVKKIQPTVLGNVQGINLPTQESWNSTITFTDSGIVKAILYADNIQTPGGSTQKIMKGNIIIDLFDENGKHSSTITSERGKANEDTYDIEVEGNVIVTSDSGVVVRSEKMIWNQQRQRVISETNVHISSLTEIIRGIGFESDQYLRDYKVFQVSGITTK